MEFIPSFDEQKKINDIYKIYAGQYSLLRLTPTMVIKNNIDANGSLRFLVEANGLINYADMQPGGANGVTLPAVLLSCDETMPVNIKFYMVTNARGDRRFSIERIKNKVQEQVFSIDDMLYFGVHRQPNGEKQLFLLDLSRNFPSDRLLGEYFGKDADQLAVALEQLKPRLAAVIHGGPYKNKKGVGAIKPKDAGDTFEWVMGLETNNDRGADYHGLIEYKTKRSETRNTLFTVRPHFDGTPVAEYEPNDRNRVSAMQRLYGYESDKHPGQKSLYVTIGDELRPANHHGFFLAVDYDAKRVNLMHKEKEGGKEKSVVVAYWPMAELKDALAKKHPSTLWIVAVTVKQGSETEIAEFKFTHVSYTRTPQFSTFLSMIERGVVTYDWRGYTTPYGAYQGKNHGNAWRINPKYTSELFGVAKELEL
ncbi:MAG TPA: restriction endonuclease [Selenomonas sp.]|nr:MvaI/BcnI family restriction endonuclease [Selenomonadaceae bacterium]HBT79693.1 restriction endonuclease [Selenomonas sp.]